MSYLVLQSVSKSFGRNKVLDGLDLTVERGETVVVFGPSGGGKTVLLRLIAGIEQPDQGDVRIEGVSLVGLGPEQRDVGMAFQNFALYPHLTAFENIASPLRAHGAEGADQKVREIARLLRIDHVLEHAPRALSNGQKQRTALARALVRGPKLLLLDDPLRNVDAKLRYEMRLELPRVLRAVHSTALYVTQDYREAMALGDRVGVLIDGKFRQIGSPRAIYSDPDDVRIASLFGDPTINLYPVTPKAGANGPEVDLFGGSVTLPPGYAGLAGRSCLLGLRPEHIEVRNEAAEDALPLELDAVTPLNVRTVLFLRAKDRSELLASAGEAAAVAFGRGHRAVWARIDYEKAMLFDAESGTRLRAAA
ncbi:MAG: ABC transporter ATP-binding protein [Geminicoccaceae bacterium]